jgi:hypothetical protein
VVAIGLYLEPIARHRNSDALVTNRLPAGYQVIVVRQPDKCSAELVTLGQGKQHNEVDAAVVVHRSADGRVQGAWGARLPSGATGVAPAFSMELDQKGKPVVMINNLIGIVGTVGANVRYGRPDDAKFVPLKQFAASNAYFFAPDVKRSPDAQRTLRGLGF